MKPVLLYLSVVIITCLFVSVSVTAQVNSGVKEAFNNGNSQQLAKFFSKNIELLIIQKEDVYSKAQAELILKDFFSKHEPDSFKIENEGYTNGVNYTIAYLGTSNGKFRIYFTFQRGSGNQLINRLNITEYK